MNRRRLLTGAPAALALIGGAAGAAVQAAVPNPDAALLALCAEFHHRHALAYDQENTDYEDALNQRAVTFREIDDISPTTEAGHRAKAKVAVIMLKESNFDLDGDCFGGPDASFALTTLRDWLGMTA